MTRAFYFGDVNIEYGGLFYEVANWVKEGYANAIRVTPCTDAGGPDNLFWVDELTVCRPSYNYITHESAEDRLQRAMDSCGPSVEEYAKLTKAQKVHAEICACVGYGLYDQMGSEMVQIGAGRSPFFNYRGEWQDPKPDRVLRGNTSLRRYARSLL